MPANSNLTLRTEKGAPVTFEEMDNNFNYLYSLQSYKQGGIGPEGPIGLDGKVGITFSTEEPVNPDLNPENTTWFQIDPDTNLIINMFKYVNGSWDLENGPPVFSGWVLTNDITTYPIPCANRPTFIYNHLIYSIGGYSVTGNWFFYGETAKTHVYVGGVWNDSLLPDLPAMFGRMRFCLNGTYLYVGGGYYIGGTQRIIKGAYRIDLANPTTWESIPYPINAEFYALVSIGNYVYTLGGNTNGDYWDPVTNFTNKTYRLDTTNIAAGWVDTNIADLPTHNGETVAFSFNNFLYALTSNKKCYKLDTSNISNAWVELDLSYLLTTPNFSYCNFNIINESATHLVFDYKEGLCYFNKLTEIFEFIKYLDTDTTTGELFDIIYWNNNYYSLGSWTSPTIAYPSNKIFKLIP